MSVVNKNVSGPEEDFMWKRNIVEVTIIHVQIKTATISS